MGEEQPITYFEDLGILILDELGPSRVHHEIDAVVQDFLVENLNHKLTVVKYLVLLLVTRPEGNLCIDHNKERLLRSLFIEFVNMGQGFLFSKHLFKLAQGWIVEEEELTLLALHEEMVLGAIRSLTSLYDRVGHLKLVKTDTVGIPQVHNCIALLDPCVREELLLLDYICLQSVKVLALTPL